LWPRLPATSLSFCATFSPANRSNSCEALSPLATVAMAPGKAVFTYTQYVQKISQLFACFSINNG
jgi:hypothetical protein